MGEINVLIYASSLSGESLRVAYDPRVQRCLVDVHYYVLAGGIGLGVRAV